MEHMNYSSDRNDSAEKDFTELLLHNVIQPHVWARIYGGQTAPARRTRGKQKATFKITLSKVTEVSNNTSSYRNVS